MKDVMVKAVPVNGLYEFVSRELTSAQLQSVLAKLRPDEARFFDGHLLATESVPLASVNRFTSLAADAKGEAVKSFGRRAGRYGAELGLRSVYRFILMVMSVDFVLKKAPFMWTRVYDGGVMNVEAQSNAATITITDFPSAVEGCARITGWFELIGERAGAKDLKLTHSACMAEGAKTCVWSFTWL